MLQTLIAFMLGLAVGYGIREQMCRRRHRRHQFIVAILLAAAVPEYAHAQNLRASKGDAQKIVTIISGDSAKIQAYCDIKKLAKPGRPGLREERRQNGRSVVAEN